MIVKTGLGDYLATLPTAPSHIGRGEVSKHSHKPYGGRNCVSVPTWSRPGAFVQATDHTAVASVSWASESHAYDCTGGSQRQEEQVEMRC